MSSLPRVNSSELNGIDVERLQQTVGLIQSQPALAKFQFRSTIEGDVDLRGFLGLDPAVRNGFDQIRMKLRIKADLPDAELQEICSLGPRFSPVFDSVANGLPVRVSAERLS